MGKISNYKTSEYLRSGNAGAEDNNRKYNKKCNKLRGSNSTRNRKDERNKQKHRGNRRTIRSIKKRAYRDWETADADKENAKTQGERLIKEMEVKNVTNLDIQIALGIAKTKETNKNIEAIEEQLEAIS